MRQLSGSGRTPAPSKRRSARRTDSGARSGGAWPRRLGQRDHRRVPGREVRARAPARRPTRPRESRSVQRLRLKVGDPQECFLQPVRLADVPYAVVAGEKGRGGRPREGPTSSPKGAGRARAVSARNWTAQCDAGGDRTASLDRALVQARRSRRWWARRARDPASRPRAHDRRVRGGFLFYSTRDHAMRGTGGDQARRAGRVRRGGARPRPRRGCAVRLGRGRRFSRLFVAGEYGTTARRDFGGERGWQAALARDERSERRCCGARRSLRKKRRSRRERYEIARAAALARVAPEVAMAQVMGRARGYADRPREGPGGERSSRRPAKGAPAPGPGSRWPAATLGGCARRRRDGCEDGDSGSGYAAPRTRPRKRPSSCAASVDGGSTRMVGRESRPRWSAALRGVRFPFTADPRRSGSST